MLRGTPVCTTFCVVGLLFALGIRAGAASRPASHAENFDRACQKRRLGTAATARHRIINALNMEL
jgi:hypothetical protein